MRNHRSAAGICAVFFLLGAGIFGLYAQLPYSGVHYARGQDVSPTFEGWERNPEGTYTLYFGYYNRNTEEEIDVPIGPANRFDMGDGDQGQPTHFYPGRRWFVFKKVVPKDWTPNNRLVWTLTSKGRTSVSKGWLQPEWEIDKALIAKNGASDPFLRITNSSPGPDNMAPVINGGSAQAITLPASAPLTVTATDDGIPKPGPQSRAGRPQGLQIRWITYRGPARVVFDPEVSPVVYGQPLTFAATAAFSLPGMYRLRAIATDGSIASTHDVDVQVNAGK